MLTQTERHQMKIVDFDLIEATGDCEGTERIVPKIKAAVANGWQLYGELQVQRRNENNRYYTKFFQAVVKYDIYEDVKTTETRNIKL